MDEAWIMHEECMEEGNAKYMSCAKILYTIQGYPAGALHLLQCERRNTPVKL